MTRILVVDNYDSFVFNLVQYLGQLGADVDVRRNDEITADAALEYDGILLSPGPGTPQDAGVCIEIVRTAAAAAQDRATPRRVPILGVCLGHQAIAAAFGGIVDRAPELLHGKTSSVYHREEGVLAGLPSPFTATRYHSLAVVPASIPAELEVTGTTAPGVVAGPGTEGVVMALRHRELPIEGVQFHPESVLTEGGHRLLANWLAVCGDTTAVDRSQGLAPVVGTSTASD